jgi:hypothetical protein
MTVLAAWAERTSNPVLLIPDSLRLSGTFISIPVNGQAKAKLQLGIKIDCLLTDAGIFTYLLKIFPEMCRNHVPGWA